MIRIISQLLVILIALGGLPLAPFGPGTETYEVEELGLTIEIPDGFAVATRTSEDNDEILDITGLTYLEMLQIFQTEDIYLDALDPDLLCEVIITMTPLEMDDFSSCNEVFLNALGEELLLLCPAEGSEDIPNQTTFYDSFELYFNEQTKYIIFNGRYELPEYTYHICLYYTVINNMAISITMQSYETEIPEEYLPMLKEIVDSIDYHAFVEEDGELWIFDDEEDEDDDTAAAGTDGNDGDDDTLPVVQPGGLAHSDTRPDYDSSTNAQALALLVCSLLTFVFYILPIMIYRYKIKCEPVCARKSMLISIIYGVIVTAVLIAPIMIMFLSVINLAPVVIGGIGCYHMLKNGKSAKTETDSVQPKKTISADADVSSAPVTGRR